MKQLLSDTAKDHLRETTLLPRNLPQPPTSHAFMMKGEVLSLVLWGKGESQPQHPWTPALPAIMGHKCLCLHGTSRATLCGHHSDGTERLAAHMPPSLVSLRQRPHIRNRQAQGLNGEPEQSYLALVSQDPIPRSIPAHQDCVSHPVLPDTAASPPAKHLVTFVNHLFSLYDGKDVPSSHPLPWEVDVPSPISQMRKLRLRWAI